MANSVVTVTGTSASPETVTIHGGDTVTWEGTSDFEIQMTGGFANPSISHNPTSGKFQGRSQPFPGRGAAYKVPYTIVAGGVAADPDVQVLP